jgi:hypothetical protein
MFLNPYPEFRCRFTPGSNPPHLSVLCIKEAAAR